jgi:hypothetical protein
MKRLGGGGRVKTFEIHWRANNVELFGNTEKLSKIRLWLKEKNDIYWVPWTIYLVRITCYNHRKYIYFSASKLFIQCKMTPPAPVVYDIPSIFTGDTVSYSSNSVVGGQYSTCRVYQKLEKNVFAKLLKNDPGYIFNDSRSQFSTEKKHPGFNIQR